MAATRYVRWYPADWRADPLVWSCSYQARYVWFEMLNLMALNKDGLLVTGDGRPMSNEKLAHSIQVPLEVVNRAVSELEENRVFSRSQRGGAIYSRRMRADNRKRKMFAEYGKLGGNPTLQKMPLNSEFSKQRSELTSGNINGTHNRVNPPLESIAESNIESQTLFTFQSNSESSGESRAAAKKPRTPRAQKTATRLTEDWRPSEQTISWCFAKGLRQDEVDEEYNSFRDWHIGKGSAWVDWDRAFQTWVRKELKHGRGRQNSFHGRGH